MLTEEQMATHAQAQKAIDAILAEGWQKIGRRLRPGSGGTGSLSEFEMVEWLSAAMRNEGLIWENGPNVSVNANSSDSHYEPTEERSAPIREGDFVLIDIWGRLDQPGSVFYDITWTGVVGREPSEREQLVFETVRNARDAAIAAVEPAFAQGRAIRGFEADDAARNVIRDAGFGDFFTHRTGHNIAQELHGAGAHLDNLETHDERLHSAPHLLLRRARHLSPRVRRPQRNQHAHRPRQSLGHRPHPARPGQNLEIMDQRSGIGKQGLGSRD